MDEQNIQFFDLNAIIDEIEKWLDETKIYLIAFRAFEMRPDLLCTAQTKWAVEQLVAKCFYKWKKAHFQSPELNQ
jgi:hypothetical protein